MIKAKKTLLQALNKNIERKNFRRVNMGMIESKGPSNDDRKINNIITKEIIQTSSYKDRRNNYNYIETIYKVIDFCYQ